MDRDYILPGSPREPISAPWNNIAVGSASLGGLEYGVSPGLATMDHRFGSPSLGTPRTPIAQEGPEVARRAAEWERQIESLDQKEMEIHQTQLRLIREQTATFRGDLLALRQEVLDLKSELSKRQSAHGDLSSAMDARHREIKDLLDRHRSDQDGFQNALHSRLAGLEREFPGHQEELRALTGRMQDMPPGLQRELEERRRAHDVMDMRLKEMHEVVGKHSQMHQDHANNITKHANIFERIGYIEKVMGDSADKHREAVQKMEQLHSRLSTCESNHGELKRATSGMASDKMGMEQKHASMAERVAYVEKLLGDSADKHSRELDQLKALHEKHVNDMKGHAMGNEAKHASVGDRLAFLEKLLGDSADKHNRELEALKNIHDKHINETKANHGSIQALLREEKNTRDGHQASFQQRLNFLENAIGESTEKHSKALEAKHASMNDRVGYLEKFLGESADKHGREIDALKASHNKNANDTKAVHGSLQDLLREEKAAREQHHATVQQRLNFLEGQIGESADKHSRALEELKGTTRGLGGHHASVADRLSYVERLLGDSADKHDAELKSAHGKIDMLTGKIKDLDVHGQALNDLRNNHARLAKEKADLETHHSTMKERVEFLEKVVGDSADKHARELEEVKAAHRMHGKNSGAMQDKLDQLDRAHQGALSHHASIEERIAYIERSLGDSADKHEKSIEAVRVANGKHANDLKAVRDLMQGEKDKRDIHHASVEERILFLERAIGESADKNAKELVAIKDSHAKQNDMLRSHTGKHASIDDRLDYIEQWFRGFRGK